MNEIQIDKLQQAVIAAAFLLVAAYALQYGAQTLTEKAEPENVEEMIARVTGENQYVISLNLNQEFNREITFIPQEELTILKMENELYQRLPDKDLYRVDYSHAQKGRYFAMVDPEQEEVIMFYRLSGVKLS